MKREKYNDSLKSLGYGYKFLTTIDFKIFENNKNKNCTDSFSPKAKFVKLLVSDRFGNGSVEEPSRGTKVLIENTFFFPFLVI